MNLNDLFNEEKVRLDPHCWDNKKIGNPKTKVKGGVRVNNCVPKESVSEAPLPGQRRDPLDLQPLEGGSASGGSLGSGIGPRPVEPLPKWTPTRIPGVDVHTGPPPTVTKPPNINSKIDPAADVPAYVRQGKPDPVTTPANKLKIKVKPGETMDQAVQRTKSEQEFNKFLQGQGGQTFGAGAGRGTVNPEPAKQQRFPELKTDTQVKWDEFKRKHGIEHPDKMAYDEKMAVDAMANRAKQSGADRAVKQNNKSDMIQPVQPSWKNRNTDVDLEEQLVAPATNAPTLRSAQGQAAGTAPQGLTPQQQTAFAPHLKTDNATGSQYYDTPDTDPKEVGAMMGTKITTPAAQALVKSPQGQAGVIKHLTAVTDPKNTVSPSTTTTTPMSPADAAAAVPDSQPASEDMHRLRELSGLADKGIEEASRKKRKEPEVDYDAIDHDKSVARLRHLAGIGPMKTVWDPARRVYKNVPTADQPKR